MTSKIKTNLVISIFLVTILVWVGWDYYHSLATRWKVDFKGPETVEEYLSEAKRLAEKGDYSFLVNLDLAKWEAEETGQDISAEINKIKKIGLPKLVIQYLQDAKKYAEKGDKLLTETCLYLAESEAEECRKLGIKINIEQGTKEIKETLKQKLLQKSISPRFV